MLAQAAESRRAVDQFRQAGADSWVIFNDRNANAHKKFSLFEPETPFGRLLAAHPLGHGADSYYLVRHGRTYRHNWR